MHYSQKKRYYFFIAIVKFKTILSYYPRWCKLGASRTSFYPSLNLRSTFAQPSLNLRSRFDEKNFELMGLLGLLGVRAAQADFWDFWDFWDF